MFIKKDINKELLKTQFKIVKHLTNLSHVLEFGNLVKNLIIKLSFLRQINIDSTFLCTNI